MAADLRKIDVHHHLIPDFYRELLGTLDPPGTVIPEASPEDSLPLMDKLNIGTSMLGYSAPGVIDAGNRDEVRALVRKCNDCSFDLRAKYPDRFGWFATLPSLKEDQEGAIAEIEHALQTRQADGITLFTSYDGLYLGADEFESIWKALDKHHAVVHIHPIHARNSAPFSTPFLPQPVVDFPHETTRTASDLVLSGRKRQFPNCKIILSHGGGTLPYLAEREAALLNTMYADLLSEKSPHGDQILEDLKTFYFDLALASSSNILDSLLKWAPQENILCGTDFPYGTAEAEYFNSTLEKYEMDEGLRKKCYRDNALRLFPRLHSHHK